MQSQVAPRVTLPKSGALGINLRVIMVSGNLALAGANDRELGLTVVNSNGNTGLGEGTATAVETPRNAGTQVFTANGAISQYADVYAAASGKVSSSPVGYFIGIALNATSADGDWVEVLRVPDKTGLIYSQTAIGSNVTATTTETDFGKIITIPANTLKVGDTIKIRALVTVSNQNSTDTLTVKGKLNQAGTPVQLFTSGAVDPAANDVCVVDFLIKIRTIGASGTFIGYGFIGLGTGGTVTAKAITLTSQSIDTTAANTISLTGTWSSNNANNVAALDDLTALKNAA